MTRIAADRGGARCVALDTGGDSLVGLLSALGAAFVLGAPIQVSALFADRFVRDFDLDRPRRFLAKPCEATSANAASRSRAKPEPVSIAPPVGTSGRTALEVMRELLASRLELDVALIEPDHRLLNDLHLNSIAVGQIVVEAARLLGRMPPVVPTNFAVATVAEAASTLEAATLLAGDANEQFPAGVDTWIRCFATQYEERQIPAQTNEAPRNWRVFAPQGRALTEPLSCLLQRDDQPAEGVAVCLSEFPTIEDQRLLLAATRCALAGPAGTMLFALHARGGGAAFARCVSLEHPNLRVLVLELPFKHPDASAWVAAEVACVARGYQRAHYEISGRRLAPMLLPLPDREPAKVSDVLSADDVVLVSGGAKGIGAECALELARRTARSSPCWDARVPMRRR
jgi:enediyne polyketide synthase